MFKVTFKDAEGQSREFRVKSERGARQWAAEVARRSDVTEVEVWSKGKRVGA